MIFNTKNPYEQEGIREYVEKLIESGSIVEIKKKSPKRSLSQNSYLHLLISYFACETGYSSDEVKFDCFKKECNYEIFKEIVVNKKGQEITRMRSSSELSTAEMTTAIERFRNFAMAKAGVYLPSPNEDQFLIYIQQEIERNKEFI